MAYSKTTWQDLPNQTTPINATNLNNIENGIKENDDKLSGTKSIDNTLYANDFKCKNLFNSSIEQGAVTGSGFDTNNERIRTSNFIKVESGKTYIVSYTSSSTLNYNISYFTTNNFPRSSETGWINSSFTVPSGINYILIVFKKTSGGNIIPSDISNVQLELGNEVTSYTEYKNFDDTTKKINIILNDATAFYYNENYVVGREIQLAGDVRATIPEGSYSQVKLFTVPSQYKPILDGTDTSIRFPMIASNGSFGYTYINNAGEVYAQIPSNPSNATAVYINIRYRFN